MLIRHSSKKNNLLGPNGNGSIFATKVSNLSHVTEQSNLNNTSDQLDIPQALDGIVDEAERSIDDKVAVVGDDGASLGDSHAELSVLGSLPLKLLENCSPCEWDDLDWDTLQPLFWME